MYARTPNFHHPARPDAISSLRGMACLMLVLYHAVGGTPEQGLRLQDGLLRGLCDVLAAVRMPLFALLAGAMHAHSQSRSRHPGARSGWTLLQDKFLRLLLPMLTVGTLFAVVQAWTPGTNVNTVNWATLHLLPVAHFWFLEALFLIFALWTLVSHWAQMQRLWMQLGLAALALTAYLSAWGTSWLAMAGAVYLMPFFGAGFLLVRHGVALRGTAPALSTSNVQHRLTLPRWVTPLLLLGAGVSLVVISTHTSVDRMTLPMLMAGLLCASTLWLMPLRHPMLAWIGERSYAIFLFHVFFTAAIRLVLVRLGWPASGGGAASLTLHVLLGLVGGVAGGAAVHQALQGRALLALLLLGQVRSRSGDVRGKVSLASRDAVGTAV